MIRDRDSIYGHDVGLRIASPGMQEVPTAVPKSGVKFGAFLRIYPKTTHLHAKFVQQSIKVSRRASVLQRFQPVNSMQDFLSPLGYEGRVD